MKKILEEYIQNTMDAKYDDEKVNSNLFNVSLVKSFREMEKLRETNVYEKFEKQNKWLYEVCNQIKQISVISFDQLKQQINKDYKSCDALFYNGIQNDDRYSLLIELKNVSRKDILEYIKSDKDDSIYFKVRDTIRMIENDIDFEGGYSGKELVKTMHFIIVYGGKANTVSEVSLGFGRKNSNIEKDSNGRQIRAVSLKTNQKKSFSKKEEDEIMRKFGEKLHDLDLVACPKGYFGIPISDPNITKKKGIGNLFYFTMFTKNDFAQLIGSEKYFDTWNWGEYREYFN